MKFTKNIVSIILAAVMTFSMSIPASAAAKSDKWAVGRLSETADDWVGWTGNGSSEFSAGTSSGSDIITIKNKDYNIAYVEKTFKVKPYTTYRFSAMVKYSGYALSSEAETKASGACVGKAYSYENSGYTTSKNWTKVEYCFTTKNETSINLCLQNGIYNGKCKGTAQFANVKLEKAEMTTDWSMLAIVFRNVNASGKNKAGKTLSDKISLTDDDEKNIKRALDAMKESIPKLSDNKMTMKNIKFVCVDDTITAKELTPYYYGGDDYFKKTVIDGFRVVTESGKIKEVIDRESEGKTYNQVMLFLPMENLSGGWNGLGGADIAINYNRSKRRDFEYSDFPDSTLVHEMLHVLANRSEAITGKETTYLHYATDFGYTYNSREWFSVYMQNKIKGGRGIDSRAYAVESGKYTLVSDDMSTGTGISGTISNTDKTSTSTTTVTASDSKKTDISKLSVSKIADRTYTGKEQRPAVKIKDGTYTLKSGTDYTVSYSNNKSVGKAKAVVTGKGNYSGKITVYFKIVPKAPTLKVTKIDGKLKVTWSKVPGATKYYVWLSKNGGKYKKIGEYDGDILSGKVNYDSNYKYQFAVTAYVPAVEGYTEFGYSDKV